MTTEQKEAIDRLNYINRAYDYNNYYSTYDLDCIDIVLNLVQDLQRKNFELNQKNEYFAWLNKDLKDEIKKLKKEIKE